MRRRIDPIKTRRNARQRPVPIAPTFALRPESIITLALLAGLGLALGPAPAHSQVLLEEANVVTYPVGALELEYAEPHPDHPSLDGFLPIEIELQRTPAGFSGPVEGEPTETISFGASETAVRRLDATAVVEILVAIVAKLHAAGLYGVDVRPSQNDFDLQSERDLRPADRTALALEVRVGRIAQIRTIAAGQRVKSDWKIDNEIHHRIRDASPLQPAGVGDDDATDLLDRRALEDYLNRLNRHSGRRVEAALSPGETAGDVVLDYRVLETKPWYAYAQASDTGTSRTSLWQTRFGVTHNQLTDRDDTLVLEYLNAGGDDVNGATARYQAPFFGPERPDWMSRRRGDPEWIDWLPREDIPWWGVDRLRWEVEFSWSRSKAGAASTLTNLANDVVTSSQSLYGGRFVKEVFQHKNFFIDLWGGLRIRDVLVDNRTTRGKGNALLVVPRVGAHAEKRSQIDNLAIDLSVQGQVNAIDQDNRVALGRADTNDRYAIVDFNFGYSTYLEPLLNPKAWRDPATHLSSTLAHEIALGLRGQVALDDARLIPQANGTLGGLYSVRGYPQSVAVGDTLVISSIEYRFHVPRIFPVRRQPLKLPLVGDFRASPQQVYGRPDWDLTLRAFIDVGRTQRNGRTPPVDAVSGNVQPRGTLERHQTLIGAGVGAELQIRSNIRARIDWATALKDVNVAGGTSPNPTPGVDFGDSEIHVLFSILY